MDVEAVFIAVGRILWVILPCVPFVLFFVGWDAQEKKCPKCGKWWARQFVQQRVITEKGGPDTCIGDPTGELVYWVNVTTYEKRYQCKYCGRSWTVTEEDRQAYV